MYAFTYLINTKGLLINYKLNEIQDSENDMVSSNKKIVWRTWRLSIKIFSSNILFYFIFLGDDPARLDQNVGVRG